MKFKVGDVVRCVREKERVLIKNRTYIVYTVEPAGINIAGLPGYCFMRDRFVIDESVIVSKILTKYGV